MNPTQQNFKQYLKALNIIHGAMFVGQLSFAAITIYLNKSLPGPLLEKNELNKIFMFIVPLFFMGAIFLSRLIVSNRMQAAMEQSELKSKLERYRTIQIIKFALMEAPAFLAIVSYLLTGELLLLGFATLITVVFVTYFPTKEKIVTELDLSRKEQTMLDDPTVVVSEVLGR